MIKALIIDDEPSAITTLQLLLQRYAPEVQSPLTASDAHRAMELLEKEAPELVFLDIQMPVLNGFELLKKIPSPHFDVIFTTAYDQYAIQAIRFSALDYLLKPIDADELRASIDRFITRKASASEHQALYRNLVYNINTDKENFRLALPTSEGTHFFLPSDIVRLEGENNYTRFFFTNKKPLLISRTIKEYEELLGNHGFLRVHKSHIVNRQHVINYSNEGILTLTDQSKVEISRRRKEEVLDALKIK